MWGQGHFSRAPATESVSFSGVVQMDEDTHYDKVEDVVGSHIEDAVTFWAQSISRNKDIMKIGCSLSEVCPQASSVLGNLDPKKIYGGLFSEDKCWYRCKVLKIISDEKCLVRYIDYGNTEILNRSDIVEIPLELQFSSVARKYKLWGLQIPSNQEVTQFDQGRTFLGSLIFEKEIKMKIKATSQDGTVIAQAEYGSVDIGEEVFKKGFAEKCKLTSRTDICEENKSDPGQLVLRNLKSPIPLWGHRSNQSTFSRPKGRLSGKLTLDLKNENDSGNPMTFPKESLAVGDFNLGSNVSLAKIKQDQKLIEENEKLKTEKNVLLESYKALELKVEQIAQELQQEKAASVDLTHHLESTLKTCVNTRMKNLAAKMKMLKEIRLRQKIDKDIQDLNSKRPNNEGNILIAQRNEMQQKVYMSVEDFILEVDESSLNKRLKTLQDLSASLEAVYGQAREGANSDEILKKFYDWKCDKREEFTNVRSETEASLQRLVAWFQRTLKVFDLSVEESLTSEDTISNIDEILEKTESSVCKELEISLTDQGDGDKEIILNTYSQILQKIRSEERLITTVQAKYKDSIEFKQQLIEYLNKTPSVDHLLSIKKTLKSLKAQLRWKLVEKNNLEESDDPDDSQIEKIKEEITQLRNNVFQEIYYEREEYEKLTSLAQKWFPELPLLHPEIGLLKYMVNFVSLANYYSAENLLDAEPMKELSSKRPLVCSEVNGQIILLKGYSVDVDTEAKVIERAAAYHRAWKEAEEESGLLPLVFLFLCKSDPMAYVMAPYYPRANLSAVQASMPLNSEEALKVMKGVAQGLHTLHKADIIHGSLHQNNVFALNREQGIVGDFDFTKSVSQRASMNMMVGDLSLISPELKMGKPASPSSDLYAYGCLLLWDDKVKSLLCSLIYYRSSITAEQVLNAECFLIPKEKSVPNPEKDTEYIPYKKEEEIKTENLDKCMEKTRNGEANFDC
uniref:Serine/threonine kinase 31 n=1 Tax=Cebus imitator TaxID=2715852 RepID=A0A2K5QUT7_CEBIM